MPKTSKQKPGPKAILKNTYKCPSIKNLPLIMEPLGKYEVLAPGSVYQPILLTPGQESIQVGPGKLDQREEKFLRGLLSALYPAGNPPKGKGTSLNWNGKMLWIKRNIEKDPSSFRLRVGDSDWFYPDFIIWILDKDTKTQTFGFVDPKGFALGSPAGWSDYKIVSTIYVPYVIEMQLENVGLPIVWNGEKWKFRVRGVLVSTSPLEVLTKHAKFNVKDKNGVDVAPSEKDFERARIVFQKDEVSYIFTVLKLLTVDTVLDQIIKTVACIRQAPGMFKPQDQLGVDLARRNSESRQSDSEFVGSLIREYSLHL